MKTTFHIESYRNGRLIDINETDFATRELAENEVKVWKEYDRNFNRRIAIEWSEKMKEEMFDETSDRLPEPLPVVKYDYKIAEYVHTIFGFYSPAEYPAVVNTKVIADIIVDTWDYKTTSEIVDLFMEANLSKGTAEELAWLSIVIPRCYSTNPSFDWEAWVKRMIF